MDRQSFLPVARAILAPVPSLNCDYCEWPMVVPQHCVEQGEIRGLLKCPACIEDDLAARKLEQQP